MRSDDQSTPLQVEEQLPPRLRALAYAVNETHQLLLAFRRRANDDQQALCVVLETSLHVDPIDPEIDVAFGRQVALAPARVLLRPGVLETANGGRREPTRILAEQCHQGLLEIPGGDALQVKDRDQHLQALRPARVGRQNRRGEANTIGALTSAVTNTGTTHGNRTNAGHDLPFGQMSMAHQPMATVIRHLVGMAA